MDYPLNKTSYSAGFSLFAFTWAMAGLFHQLSFEGWRWYDVKGNVLTAAVLLVLSKPSSWKRFALYLAIDWFAVAWTFPIHANHIVFSWIVNGTLLAALGLVAWKNKGVSESDMASRWYEAFAPWLRIELCMLYFFTVFHKLNEAYFDTDWSCAVTLYVEIDERFPMFPVAEWAKQMTIYGTLIFETAIPLLLLFSRTRVAGIILGLFFHAMLSLHSHPGLFSFSATMTPFFTLFLPAGVAELLKPKTDLLKRWRWVLAFMAFVFVLCIFRKWLPSGLLLDEMIEQHLMIGFVAYYIYFAVVVTMFIRSWKSWNEMNLLNGSWKSHRLLLVFVFLLFVNGFGPYLGLKTQTSFSMFSNLHTENAMSNHLLVPSGIQITDWQHDVVEIIDSNDPHLISMRDNGLLMVFLDLRRIRSSPGSNFWVTFRGNGRNETFDITRPETHNVIPALNLLSKRYFYFRPVERDPAKVKCKH